MLRPIPCADPVTTATPLGLDCVDIISNLVYGEALLFSHNGTRDLLYSASNDASISVKGCDFCGKRVLRCGVRPAIRCCHINLVSGIACTPQLRALITDRRGIIYIRDSQTIEHVR